MSLENWILILQVHFCLVEPSTARHEDHRGDSGFAEANAGLQPAAVLKPDRDNDTYVIRGPAIRKAGWRPFVLYAIQEIMAVYRNPYHQGTLLLSLWRWQEGKAYGEAGSGAKGSTQWKCGLQSGLWGDSAWSSYNKDKLENSSKYKGLH